MVLTDSIDVSEIVYNKSAAKIFAFLWPMFLLLSLAVDFGLSFSILCQRTIEIAFGYELYMGDMLEYEQRMLIALSMISMMLSAAYKHNPVVIVRKRSKN